MRIQVVDSHTEGEPTRVIVSGWPEVLGATMSERRDDLRARYEHLRRGVVCEPRGTLGCRWRVVDGAGDAEAPRLGIVFFNNGTYLGMCGHGLIGVVRTLEHLGRLAPGIATFDTPVGTVSAELSADGQVTIENVPSRCHALDVSVDVPGIGPRDRGHRLRRQLVFITHLDRIPVDIANAPALLDLTQAIQDAIRAQGITGERRRGHRPHRYLCGAPAAGRRRAELRPLFWRRVRPLALRDRNVGHDGGPPRAWSSRAWTGVAPGKRVRESLHWLAHGGTVREA